MQYFKASKCLLLIIFCVTSFNLSAQYFEKIVNSISEKTSIAPETVKNGIIISLVLGSVASLIGGTFYLDHYYNKQRQLAENKLTDEEIINEERLVLEGYIALFEDQFSHISDLEKLKDSIVKASSFPHLLRFKSKVIEVINCCARSLNRIEYRLEPSMEINTHNRNIEELQALKNEFEILIAQLYALKDSVNDCIRSTFIEYSMLLYIMQATERCREDNNRYVFAHLAEDLI